METALYLSSVVFFLLTLYFLIKTLLMLRINKKQTEQPFTNKLSDGKEKEEWLKEQIAIALKHLESNDEGKILSACQALAVLDHPDRAKAIQRLAKLTNSRNQKIVKQATLTYTTLQSKSVLVSL